MQKINRRMRMNAAHPETARIPSTERVGPGPAHEWSGVYRPRSEYTRGVRETCTRIAERLPFPRVRDSGIILWVSLPHRVRHRASDPDPGVTPAYCAV